LRTSRWGCGWCGRCGAETGITHGSVRRSPTSSVTAWTKHLFEPIGRIMALPPGGFDRIEAIEAFARDGGRSLLDVAIGGLATRPAVASVIAGATSPEQVRANVAAGGWEPTANEDAELRALTAQSG